MNNFKKLALGISLCSVVMFSSGLTAGVTITKPLLILTNSGGEVVATGSTSISKAMEKASNLAPGVYTLQRPDVTITVSVAEVVNLDPVADAGLDQTVTSGELVYLYCDKSFDPDGKIVLCDWEQTGGPAVDIKYTDAGLAYYDPSKIDRAMRVATK